MNLATIAAAAAPDKPQTPLAERLGATFRAPLEDSAWFEGGQISRWGQPAVTDSAELSRVVAVPRRPIPTRAEQEAMAETMTALLRRDNPACRCAELNPQAVKEGRDPCIRRLNRFQGWYLWEAFTIPRGGVVRGVVGSAGAGHGKTGPDILLPMVTLGPGELALCLIKASLRPQFELNYQQWAQHFRVPNLAGGAGVVDPTRPVLEVLSYTQISRPENTAYLEARKPKVLIADECQALGNLEASGTARLFASIGARPDTLFFPHSGSLSGKGLKSWWHILAASLREHSPAPLQLELVKEWGACLDPFTEERAHLRAPIGALRKLCQPGEDARDGFRRRLRETFGVVSTDDLSVSTRIRMEARTPTIPTEVKLAIREVRETGDRPDGETLLELLEVLTCCRQLACGFYYRWRFPHVYDARGAEVEDEEQRREVVDTWFKRRRAWGAEMRARMVYRVPFMDSPALLRDAAIRKLQGYRGELPVWESKHWKPWADFEKRVEAIPDVVRVSDYLVRDAADWAREYSGIVWVRHRAFGDWLAELTGLPYYGQEASKVQNLNPTKEMQRRRAAFIERERETNPAYHWSDTPGEWIQTEDGTRPIIASVWAHGTGKNLQAWNRALFANDLADHNMWDQALARMHRPGQSAEVVHVDLYQHTSEMQDALAKAIGGARYQQQTEGVMNRLLFADWGFEMP